MSAKNEFNADKDVLMRRVDGTERTTRQEVHDFDYGVR